MVVDVIAYPLPMREVYVEIPNVLGQTSHSAENSAQAAFQRPLFGGKEGINMLTFFRDEEGQGLVEYALIIAVIAIAVIVAMVFLRGQLQNIFSNIGNNLT
jgi:pilus assembly protein Flp/PilA